MTTDTESSFHQRRTEGVAPNPILSFVSAHYEGLWCAARRLGGCEAARLVDRCVELLAHDGCLTWRTRIMLDQILAVMTLEKVDDPNLPYMKYFAEIDPVDPFLEEISLLADEFRDALDRSIRTISFGFVA